MTIDDFDAGDRTHAKAVKNIYDRLWAAGKNSDVRAAAAVLDDASSARLRAVDILLGIVAPMLYEIGRQWERAVISVADEHRFTTFCEELFDLVSTRRSPELASRLATVSGEDVVLLNAAGNQHTLALRILSLWLAHEGVHTWPVSRDGDVADAVAHTVAETMALVQRVNPKMVLVSMSLAEQRAGVVAVVESLTTLPETRRPRILVGGYAVKMGLVEPIAGAQMLADISQLQH